MTHCSQEELDLYCLDAASAPEYLRDHLRDCAACIEELRRTRAFHDLLADPEAWRAEGDTAPDEEEALLLEIAQRGANEDAAARESLKPYLAKPLRFLWPNVLRKPEFQTAGAVRVLCAEANAACERQPTQALTLADAAIVIAEALSSTHDLGQSIELLRGLAWKERANALRYLSNFQGALDALDRAERAYHRAPLAWLELAVVAYVRATVLADSERLDEAERWIAVCLPTFAQGDATRWINAKLLEGAIRFRRGDFRGALSLWQDLLLHAEASDNGVLAARLSGNIANAYVELGDAASAGPHFTRALRAYQEFGMTTEIARARWKLARLAVVEGKFPEGIRRLRAAIEELERLNLVTEPLRAGLDLVDALLAAGQAAPARMLCQQLVKRCKSAHLEQAALQAFGYLRDASRAGRLDRSEVRHVHRFIERLEYNPHLSFGPREPSES
jgi:tetratricopeptide (TPR) repeat protein